MSSSGSLFMLRFTFARTALHPTQAEVYARAVLEYDGYVKNSSRWASKDVLVAMEEELEWAKLGLESVENSAKNIVNEAVAIVMRATAELVGASETSGCKFELPTPVAERGTGDNYGQPPDNFLQSPRLGEGAERAYIEPQVIVLMRGGADAKRVQELHDKLINTYREALAGGGFDVDYVADDIRPGLTTDIVFEIKRNGPANTLV